MFNILLSQGHGPGKAHNRGALCYNEGDNNFYYSLVLKEELEKYEDVNVDLVRKNINDDPYIHDRAKMGKGYDLYLAIHSNAASQNVRGTEVWDSIEKPNKALAKTICDATAALFNHNNRGVKYKEGQPGYNWYGELRFNGAKSAMIVENGFHTNSLDCNFFKNNHKKIAVVQAKVIADYYNLKIKEVDTVAKDHWGEEVYENLNKKGIVFSEKRFNDKLTRAEAFAITLKITEWVEEKLKEVK